MTESPLEIPRILAHEVADDAVILDVRSNAGFEKGHTPNAVNIPLEELESRLDDVPSADPLVVTCADGERAAQATVLLRQHGVNAVQMIQGMKGWVGAKKMLVI